MLVLRLRAEMALGILHDHIIILHAVRLAKILIRVDPPSVFLMDHGGCRETSWRAKMVNTAQGDGEHRTPSESGLHPVARIQDPQRFLPTVSIAVPFLG